MRIAALVAVVVLLVAGGFWLAQNRGPTAPEGAGSQVPVADSQGAETSEQPEVPVPEGYELVPFLVEEPVGAFEEAEFVLEEGLDYAAVIETSKGRLVIDLHQDEVPRTVNNFVFLARNRYYDGIVFHRVLEDFMAQTGDPTGTGRGGPGYQFDDEIDPNLTHDQPGVLSMANSGPNTNGSQFFITLVATPWLDGRHAVFGRVIEGLDVLDQLTHIDPSQAGSEQPDRIAELYVLASG